MNDKETLLSELRDVDVPDVAWSIAPGWWLLLIALAVLVMVVIWLIRRWQARLWQRQAQQELQSITEQMAQDSGSTTLSRCSRLARQIVLAVDQREHVAALHGDAWLAKLDDICARPQFSQGIGRLLADQPYQKQPLVSERDLNDLLESMDVLVKSAPGYKPRATGADATLDKLAQGVKRSEPVNSSRSTS